MFFKEIEQIPIYVHLYFLSFRQNCVIHIYLILNSPSDIEHFFSSNCKYSHQCIQINTQMAWSDWHIGRIKLRPLRQWITFIYRILRLLVIEGRHYTVLMNMVYLIKDQSVIDIGPDLRNLKWWKLLTTKT